MSMYEDQLLTISSPEGDALLLGACALLPAPERLSKSK